MSVRVRKYRVVSGSIPGVMETFTQIETPNVNEETLVQMDNVFESENATEEVVKAPAQLPKDGIIREGCEDNRSSD
uniref:Uncharacterized protein n=1 Tax=Romanomermis culicivorax TaxID=13658 RepID=A0A915IJF7_ROMCU